MYVVVVGIVECYRQQLVSPACRTRAEASNFDIGVAELILCASSPMEDTACIETCDCQETYTVAESDDHLSMYVQAADSGVHDWMDAIQKRREQAHDQRSRSGVLRVPLPVT